MKILSIDTTSIAGSVALSEDDALIAQEQQGASGTHSEKLIATIDHLLGVANWDRTDLQAIAVAVGPGSFTGLRIGLATAKGLAMALGLPLAGASSLKSLALNGRGFDGTVASLIDARRGEIYASAARVKLDGSMEEVMGECVLPPDALVKELSSIEGELLLVGDGAIAYEGALTDGLGGRARMASGVQVRPQAINLAALSLERLVKGGDDLAKVVPNYVRRSDAEIGFMGKSKKKS
jgi:tRNA threonylcarbamoyladenosine biosynthesis protein TsaB